MSDTSNKEIKKFPLDEIPPDSFFSDTAYLDKNFSLAAPEMPFSTVLIDTLKTWGFLEVFSTGEVLDDYAADTSAETTGVELAEATILGDNEKTRKVEDFYVSFQKYTENLFSQVAVKNELDYKQVAEKVKDACDIIREDRRFLLRILKSTPDSNYLASHAVKSTIISIIIGNHLKLPNHRLIELGIAALLHEIGMTKLPARVYLSNRPLDTQERKTIMTHPLIGYNMLKTFSFPLTVTLGALEHHERENGK